VFEVPLIMVLYIIIFIELLAKELGLISKFWSVSLLLFLKGTSPVPVKFNVL